MKNNILSSFFEVINNNVTKSEGYRQYYKDCNVENIIKYIENLPNLDRRILFSSKYWNKYPKYTYYLDSGFNNRGFYKTFYLMIDEINMNKNLYKNTYNSLVKYSEGVLLNLCLDLISGTKKIALAKRAINSADQRNRIAAIRILPVKSIEKYANDKNYAIRKIVSNRVGISARPEIFINCRDSNTRAKAINSSDLKKDDIYKRLEDGALSKMPTASLKEVKSLLDHLNNEEIIYILDISKNYKSMEKYIERRLSAR